MDGGTARIWLEGTAMRKLVGWTIAVVLVLIAIWAVSFPFVIGALDKDLAAQEQARADFPIRLGTGGLGCDIDTEAVQFTSADRIRLVGDQAPGADEVIIYLFPLPNTVGQKVIGPYPVHRTFASPVSCVSEDLPPLSDGEYEAWIHIGDSRAHVDFRVGAP